MYRYSILPLFIALLLAGCANEKLLYFETLKITETTCKECPEVTVKAPVALPKEKLNAQKINKTINQHIIEILSYSDDVNPTSIEEAIKVFNSEFNKIKEDFPNQKMAPWQSDIVGEVSYSSNFITSISVVAYTYAGGAHGNTNVTFLNFDTKQGNILSIEDVFLELAKFKTYAEKAFRIEHNIGDTSAINSTGFMFDNDTFQLPKNIGFDKGGIVLYYNQYEIAPYSEGPIIVKMPYDEVMPFLAMDL